MYYSNNPDLLPNIFKDFSIPFGRNKETGAFFVPTMKGGTADEMVEHYATVSAACDRALADIDPSCVMLIAGLNQMKNDASRKSAVAVKRDKAWEFAGPGTGEKASGGPPPFAPCEAGRQVCERPDFAQPDEGHSWREEGQVAATERH